MESLEIVKIEKLLKRKGISEKMKKSLEEKMELLKNHKEVLK